MWNLRNKTANQGKEDRSQQIIGIKESTYDEHQVMYGIVESLDGTLETNIALYGN